MVCLPWMIIWRRLTISITNFDTSQRNWRHIVNLHFLQNCNFLLQNAAFIDIVWKQRSKYVIKWRQISSVRREPILDQVFVVKEPLAPFQKLNKWFWWIKTEMAPNFRWIFIEICDYLFWNCLVWQHVLQHQFFSIKLM